MRRVLVVALVLAAFVAPLVAATPTPASAAEPVRLRKDVKDLTAHEKKAFVAAVLKLKQTPSPWNSRLSWYDQFVYWHKNAFRCSISAAHMQPSFLPWHRQFLLLFEDALREVSGKPISVPYWDWTNPNSTAAVFAPDMMGGNGNPAQGYAVTTGPFRKGAWKLNVRDPKSNDPWRFRYLVRRFATPIGHTLPTGEQVSLALSRPKYDVKPFDAMSDPKRSFRNYMEGWRRVTGMECEDGLMNPVEEPGAPHKMHNRVHLWVGGVWGRPKKPFAGTMTLNTSPNDPVFWLHHANIDRIWSQWEAMHDYRYRPIRGAPRGQNLHDTMWPYRTVGIKTTIADLLHIDSLGYAYTTP
jgi:tyrosinase